MTGIYWNPNVWVHVVGTFDGNTINVYENGSLKASNTWTTTIATSTNPLYIG